MMQGGAWSGMCKLQKEISHVELFWNSIFFFVGSLVIVSYSFGIWDRCMYNQDCMRETSNEDVLSPIELSSGS
jgi:hypothetical protein